MGTMLGTQLRSRFRLAQKARFDGALEREFWRQHLDGDVPLEALVARSIDDAHPAASDFAVQLVVRTQDPLDVRAKLRTRGRTGGIYRRLRRQSAESMLRAQTSLGSEDSTTHASRLKDCV